MFEVILELKMSEVSHLNLLNELHSNIQRELNHIESEASRFLLIHHSGFMI